MTKKTIIEITDSAQEEIKAAIGWRSRNSSEDEARNHIKGVLSDWKNQMLVAPESGGAVRYLDNPRIREVIKGNYRMVYQVEESDDCFKVYLLIFCSTRQDYQTLLKLIR